MSAPAPCHRSFQPIGHRLSLGSNSLVAGDWVQVVNVTATGADAVTGSYYLTLDADASDCSSNGASAIGGEPDVQVSGQQTVPLG